MTIERREARLRPECAALYVGVPADRWQPARELLDRVTAARLLSGRRSGEFLSARGLDERHFEFRGGPTDPAGPGRRHTRELEAT